MVELYNLRWFPAVSAISTGCAGTSLSVKIRWKGFQQPKEFASSFSTEKVASSLTHSDWEALIARVHQR